MEPTASIPTASRAMRLMHAVLLLGVLFIGAVLGAVVHLGERPVLVGSGIVGIVLAAVPLAIVVLAGSVLRSRIPQRRRDQSPASFWEDPGTRGSALVLWMALEGAALIAVVAYALTATIGAAAVAILAAVALGWFRPGHLEHLT